MGVSVALASGVAVLVAVGSGVVGVLVAVGVAVFVGVGVAVLVGVGDGVMVGVGVDSHVILLTVIASPSHALLVDPLISAERPSCGSKSILSAVGIIR